MCLYCVPSIRPSSTDGPLRATSLAGVGPSSVSAGQRSTLVDPYNEAFYVGFPHPDVGCLNDLYFVFYV